MILPAPKLSVIVVASISIAVIIGLAIAPLILHSLPGEGRELEVSTGLAYLRVRAERLVDDPVLGSGTLVTYIAEVVVRNEDSVTIEVKDLRFELPMSVEVMGECGSDHSTTVVEEASSLGGSASKALCLTQLSLPPNEEVRLSGGYSLDNDILLGREDFMRSGWVISYYVPAGTERHVVISGHVFLTDIAEERAWEVLGRAHVIAVVRVVGEAYGGADPSPPR